MAATKYPEFHSPLLPCNLPLRRCAVPREQASHRILIMRLGAFGDILMGTPLLAALREAYPEAHLTWVVEHKEAQAIDASPYIDEYLVWNGSFWKQMLRRGLYPLWLLRALRFQKTLRAKQYDIFISFQPEEWPLLVRGVNAGVNIGVFDTFWQTDSRKATSPRTRLYSTAYTHRDLPAHRTNQYLLPLRALGVPEPHETQMSLGFTAADAAAAQEFLRGHGLAANKPFAVLAPMTTWQSRCWPADRYARLGDALAETLGLSVVLIGSQREAEAVAGVASQMKTAPVLASGVLTFREMAALIAKSALLVSGDTGPMHVAAAVNTPYVALFGPTPAPERAPLTGRGLTLLHPVPCGPCDQKVCPNSGDNFMLCMNLLTVEEVLAASKSLLPTP